MPFISLIFGVQRGQIDRRIGETVAQLSLWRERARSRSVLATLDDRMLRDVGIDRATADEESRTRFWR
jgi:uncharacterized protein YjiS (DUF1127 family)